MHSRHVISHVMSFDSRNEDSNAVDDAASTVHLSLLNAVIFIIILSADVLGRAVQVDPRLTPG